MHQAYVAPVLAAHLQQGRLGGTDGASAAARAMVVLARNFGRKSSTAMTSWSRTTFFAHLRPVSCRCRAIFLYVFARNLFASR